MATDRGPLAGPHRPTPWRLLAVTVAVVASQAWPWAVVLPLLPAWPASSRSPSSDVLLQGLPLAHAAETLEALHASLPNAPGVVVAHAPGDAMASAYMVVAMRLWPRPVSYIACEPAPHVEQFRVPHEALPPAWRVDLVPGDAVPLRTSSHPTADPRAACATLRP